MATTAGALGTLAATGFFTPGDVKNEAELLHSATLALGASLASRIDAASSDLLAGWDAFVSDEKDFYGRAQSFFYFVDFSDNASRDQVLALEGRFNDFHTSIGATAADTGDDGGDAPSGDDATSIAAVPIFSAPGARTEHSLLAESGGPVDQATKATEGELSKLVDQVKSAGWEVVVAALLVIVPVGIILVQVARSGAVKVGV